MHAIRRGIMPRTAKQQFSSAQEYDLISQLCRKNTPNCLNRDFHLVTSIDSECADCFRSSIQSQEKKWFVYNVPFVGYRIRGRFVMMSKRGRTGRSAVLASSDRDVRYETPPPQHSFDFHCSTCSLPVYVEPLVTLSSQSRRDAPRFGEYRSFHYANVSF